MDGVIEYHNVSYQAIPDKKEVKRCDVTGQALNCHWDSKKNTYTVRSKGYVTHKMNMYNIPMSVLNISLIETQEKNERGELFFRAFNRINTFGKRVLGIKTV